MLTSCQPLPAQTQSPITPPKPVTTSIPAHCDPITASNDSGLAVLTQDVSPDLHDRVISLLAEMGATPDN